ncbi:MAG: RNA polymerase sigma factor [Acidimicrobiales bacterium]
MTQSTFARVGEIAAGLSENQRRVFVLRDIQGWSPAEVCGLLDLSEVNQRVLLHRARSRVRAALENDLGVPS